MTIGIGVTLLAATLAGTSVNKEIQIRRKVGRALPMVTSAAFRSECETILSNFVSKGRYYWRKQEIQGAFPHLAQFDPDGVKVVTIGGSYCIDIRFVDKRNYVEGILFNPNGELSHVEDYLGSGDYRPLTKSAIYHRSK